MTRRALPTRGVRAAGASLCICIFIAGTARAEGDDGGDGTHGRIEGDVAVVGSLGATFGPRAPRASVDGRLRYLSTVGVFGTYEDGSVFGGDAIPRRVVVAGAELRPLFLARWLQGWSTGAPRVDLTIDSLALELGVVATQPESGPFSGRPGLQLGGALELPFFARATGPLLALRGGVRWGHAALAGQVDGPLDRAGYFALAVGWQQLFGAHVVDVGDRAPR
jgi:hypothetical protein